MQLKNLVLFLVLLTGCEAPGQHFRHVDPKTAMSGGSVFEIRQRGTLVEAIRLNSRYAPRLGRVADEAKLAIERTTGCRVTRVLGDAAVIIARVVC